MQRFYVSVGAVVLGLVGARIGTAAEQAGYTYQKIVSFGQDAPGGGSYANDFEASEVNDNGQFTFLAEPGGTEKIFFWDGSAASQIGGPPLKAPDGAPFQGNVYSPHGINNAGKVVYGESVTNADGAREEYMLLVDTKSGQVEILAKRGMPATDAGTFGVGGTAVPTRIFGDINNRDEVAFSHSLVPADGSDTHDAVFMRAEGTLKIIARAGTTLPSGEKVLNAWWPRINDASQISFVANTEENPDYGIYLWDQGTITTVLKPGTDLGGVKIAQGKWATIGNSGDVVFVGEVGESSGTADVSGDTGVFLFSNKQLIPVVKPGDVLPGGGTFRQIEPKRGSVAVNKDGTVVFIAVISDTEGGAFVSRGGKLDVIARTGMTIDGLGSIGPMGRDVAGFTSYNIGMNDKGQVVFPTTSNGTPCLALATPAAPAAGN